MRKTSLKPQHYKRSLNKRFQRGLHVVQPVPTMLQPEQDGAPASARRAPSPDDEKMATVLMRRCVCGEPQSGHSVSLSSSDICLRT
jgi:hypothetical protein